MCKVFFCAESFNVSYHQVARPAPFFHKRNASRIVIRNRNSVTRTTTAKPTTLPTTELPKLTRKVMRRKITRNPNVTRKVQTTTVNYERFSEGIDDELASVLPALTTARPRKPFKPAKEITTQAAPKLQPNRIEETVQKVDRKPSSFDEILQQQYKIKGIDVSSEENYEEDERLIGVLGSQVCCCQLKCFFLSITSFSFFPKVKVILHSLSNDPESVQVECLDVGKHLRRSKIN